MEIIEALGSRAPAHTENRFSDLSSQEFVEIIFAELANQNPLEPSDTGALLDQLSTLRSIQSDINLQSKLESLVAQNELTSAASMIGKFVSGVSAEGEFVEDFVFSVTRTQDGPVLNLDSGKRLTLANVHEIVDLSQFRSRTPPTPPAGGQL
ncbi:MAG: hypothetical protein IIC49_03395 [Planctomycetes bacterium]|nr:hypothetical protein [Planctomycetota bacterium]